MDEFEFRSHPITDYGVAALVSENYTFTRFPLQFFFRSFLYLQITRTGIISNVFELIPGHCFKFRVISRGCHGAIDPLLDQMAPC